VLEVEVRVEVLQLLETLDLHYLLVVEVKLLTDPLDHLEHHQDLHKTVQVEVEPGKFMQDPLEAEEAELVEMEMAAVLVDALDMVVPVERDCCMMLKQQVPNFMEVAAVEGQETLQTVGVDLVLVALVEDKILMDQEEVMVMMVSFVEMVLVEVVEVLEKIILEAHLEEVMV